MKILKASAINRMLLVVFMLQLCSGADFEALVLDIFNAHNTLRTDPAGERQAIMDELNNDVFVSSFTNKLSSCKFHDGTFNAGFIDGDGTDGHSECSAKGGAVYGTHYNDTSPWDSAIVDLGEGGYAEYPTHALKYSLGPLIVETPLQGTLASTDLALLTEPKDTCSLVSLLKTWLMVNMQPMIQARWL